MKVTLERVISDELKREMSLDGGTFAGLEDRDSVTISSARRASHTQTSTRCTR